MRWSLAATLGVLLLFLYMCLYADFSGSLAAVEPAATFYISDPATPIDFDKQIKPIFQARCQPCHFNGGAMYDRLPFDSAATIKQLGDKLFTRIKDEEEQRLLREFLKQ